jgi:glycine/D-amino acid oxidase-like deaminating enzyme
LPEKFDIIVVGAGILGVATAYYLQKNNPDKSILLLDRLPDAGQANTAMSAAAIRNMFSSKTNQLLTDTSIAFFRHIQEELDFALTLDFCGYLWLLSEQQFKTPSVKNWMQRMEETNIAYDSLDRKELEKRIPGLVTEFSGDEEAELMHLNNVDFALFGSECGVLDPSLLVQFYKQEFTKLSQIKPRFNVTVESLILEAQPKLDIPGEPFVWQEKAITGVRTNQGELHSEAVVVATGPWTNTLLDPVGIASHIKAKKRQLFIVAASDHPPLKKLLFTKTFSDAGFIPFTILPSGGCYLRGVPEETAFWIGCADRLGRAYRYTMQDEDYNAERAYYENSIYPVLSKYFPAFLNIRPTNSWAGDYAYSIDAIPLVYYTAGALVVTGASGSGIMKADAIARMADALYRGEKNAELFGGRTIEADALGLTNRKVEEERVLI